MVNMKVGKPVADGLTVKPQPRQVQVERRVMPILSTGNKLEIPFAWLKEKVAMENHGQTLEQLADRGGVSPSEAVALMDDWIRVTDKIGLQIINHRLSALSKA